jgi:O-succinylbenzoic acid--CoA ligase
MVCALPPGRFLAGAQGCGPPLHDVELRLEDEAGGIAVRSARLSPGWFAMGRLHPFRDPEGWWRSGDAGTWSVGPGPDAPSLTIQGRLDGAIHSGGETVFPEQVRQRLLLLIREEGLPVAELLLLRETDPLWGERLVALVRLQTTSQKPARRMTERQELRQLEELARALPPSQRPARWLNCPSLTPSESGKWRLEHWRQWLQSQSARMD